MRLESPLSPAAYRPVKVASNHAHRPPCTAPGRDVHSNYKKKGFTAEQLNSGVKVCRPCHSAVHRTYTNKVLASDYSTLEALLAVRRPLGVESVGAKA